MKDQNCDLCNVLMKYEDLNDFYNKDGLLSNIGSYDKPIYLGDALLLCKSCTDYLRSGFKELWNKENKISDLDIYEGLRKQKRILTEELYKIINDVLENGLTEKKKFNLELFEALLELNQKASKGNN